MTIKLKEIRSSYTLSMFIQDIPTLYLSSEENECLSCRIKLKVQKVTPRKIYTVHYGEIIIKEYTLYCPLCKEVYCTDELAKLVKSGCNYSYDCLVKVGELRYLEKRQIEEIKNIFHQKYHIPISSTQVRRLCYQFLLYLGKFHYLNVSKINKSMAKNGGYISHIDSTCEGRKPHLLTCLDALSGYVLYSQKISGENEVELTSALQKVKSLYGIPLCIIHDMGFGINKAVDLVFPGVQQVICHFHLLRDIGKDLFESEYRGLQKQLSQKKIYADIRYQIKALEKSIGNTKKAQELFFGIEKKQKELSPLQLLQGVLYGYLMSLKFYENIGDGYGFPFDRPKYQYYQKIVEIYNQMEELESKQFFSRDKERSRLYKIKGILRKVVKDKSLKKNVVKLEKKIIIFDELRQIMRIALPDAKSGLNDCSKIENPKELNKMEEKLLAYIQKLKKWINKVPEFSNEVLGVVNEIEKYWDKIFAKPIKVKLGDTEKIIIPQRTNNISEQFYRKLKQLFRRLHGRRHVRKDLLFLPEEIALIENLRNIDYINDLLGSMDRLVEEFSLLDRNSIETLFEKKDAELFVPYKIINALSNFKPLESVVYYFKNCKKIQIAS